MGVERVGFCCLDRPSVAKQIALGQKSERLGYEAAWVTEARLAREAQARAAEEARARAEAEAQAEAKATEKGRTEEGQGDQRGPTGGNEGQREATGANEGHREATARQPEIPGCHFPNHENPIAPAVTFHK